MGVLRRTSSSLQHVKAISLSVVMLFNSTPRNILESAARIVLRFLLDSFRIQVFLATLSTATRSTQELSLDTMKSNSRCPNSFGNGLSSMYFMPSLALFQCPRFLPPLWLFQPQ